MLRHVSGSFLGLTKVLEASVLSFIAMLAFGIYEFILPIFTESESDSFGIVGIIVSLVYVASFFSEIPVGLMVDKYGRIKVLLASMSALSVLGIIYFLTSNLLFLAALSLVFGAISVAFWIPSTVMIRDFSPRNRLGQSEGIFMTITQLGYVIAPILAGFIATTFAIKHNFLAMSVFFVLAVIFGALVFLRKKAATAKKSESGHKHKAKLILLATIFKEFMGVHMHAKTAYFLTAIAYAWIAVEWTFVSLAGMERFGLSEAIVGILVGAMMVVSMLLYYVSGYLMDKIGKRYIITSGFLLLFSTTYFVFLSNNLAIFILASLFAAAAVSWILPGTEALLTEIIPANLYGEMSGVFDTSKDFGLIIGPLVGGVLATTFDNPLMPFLFIAVMAGAATIWAGYVFWPGKKRARK